MKPGRILSFAAAAGVALLCGFLLLALARKADRVHGAQLARAAAEAPVDAANASWRLSLRFDQTRTPAGVLGQGWSAPEPGSGVWSVDELVALELPARPGGGPARVVLSVEPFVADGYAVQRVRLRAGSKALGEWRLTGGTSQIAFAVPAELADPRGGLALQIELPDAAAPADHVKGATDARRLGVKLHAVELFG